MDTLIYYNLIFLLYSVNGELREGGSIISSYVPPSSFNYEYFHGCYEYAMQNFQGSGYIPDIEGQRSSSNKSEEDGGSSFYSLMSNPQFEKMFRKCMEGEQPQEQEKPDESSSKYRKRAADGGGNPFVSYMPPGMPSTFNYDSFKQCYKYAMDNFQGPGGQGGSGYFPGMGGQNIANYFPGMGGKGRSGDKNEEGGGSNFSNMMENPQFEQMFKKCMEGGNSEKPGEGDKPGKPDEPEKPEKPDEYSSTYRKRAADGGGNPFVSYMPPGMPSTFNYDSFKQCYKYAMDNFQGPGGQGGSGYFPGMGGQNIANYFPGMGGKGRSGDKNEEGGGSNFSNMMENPQFEQMFKKCMEGGNSEKPGEGDEPGKPDEPEKPEKPDEYSSTYRKRAADGGGNPFVSYMPPGMPSTFNYDSFKQCYKYAMDNFQGPGGQGGSGYFPGMGGQNIANYFPGMGGKGRSGDKNEEGGGSNFSNMMENPQFEQMFKKCMEGGNSEKPGEGDKPGKPDEPEKPEKPDEYSSTYRKRAADGGGNPFVSYMPPGMPSTFNYDSFKQCYKYTMDNFQGPGGQGGSGYFPGMGGQNIANYFPGMGGKGRSGDKNEEGGGSNFSNMMENPQFEQMFKKCMEGGNSEKPGEGDKPGKPDEPEKPEKPDEYSSTYRKRAADGGGNPFVSYMPPGMPSTFNYDSFKQCYKYAMDNFQGPGGQGGSGYFPGMGGQNIANYFPGMGGKGRSGDKNEEGGGSNFSNMMENPQFEQMFKKCMEGGNSEKPGEGDKPGKPDEPEKPEKPDEYSSTYRKRAADGGGNPFVSYMPPGMPSTFNYDSFKQCYKYAMDNFQGPGGQGGSGYFPGMGGQNIANYFPGMGGKGRSGDKNEEGGGSNFSNMMENPQFEQMFKKCMEGGNSEKPGEGDKPGKPDEPEKPEKPDEYSSTYRKRAADGGGNPFVSYMPPGMPSTFNYDSFKQCYKYAMDSFQGPGGQGGSGYFPGMGGQNIANYFPGMGGKGRSCDKNEEGDGSNFSNMMANPQFEQMFRKCMEAGNSEKPEEGDKPGKPDEPEKPEKPEKPDEGQKPEKPDEPEKPVEARRWAKRNTVMRHVSLFY